MRGLFALLAVFLITVSPITLPTGAEPSERTPREKAAEDVVRRYFAAFERKNLDAMMAEWDPKAPDYNDRKQRAKKLFAETGPVAVKNLAFTFTRTWDDSARIHLRIVLSGTDTKTGAAHIDLLGWTIEPVVELVWRNDEWKIREYDSAARYYPRLLGERLQKVAERREFLILHKELVPQVFRLLCRVAFSRREQIDEALRLCARAAEIAEFHDSLTERAWVHLHRGLVLESGKQHAEALKELDAALDGFRREQLDDGEYVALLARGRVLGRLGRNTEAAKEFERVSGPYRAFLAGDRQVSHDVVVSYIQSEEYHNEQVGRLRAAWDREDPAVPLGVTKELLRLETEMYGPVHTYLANTHQAAAEFHARLGDFASATESMTAARKILTSLYGTDHDRTTNIRVHVALIEKLAGLTADERKRYWTAKRDEREALGLTGQRKYDESLKLLDGAQTVYRKLLGVGSSPEAETLFEIAGVHKRRSDQLAVAEACERANPIYTKHYGEGHEKVQQNVLRWSLALQAIGERHARDEEYTKARDVFAVIVKLSEGVAKFNTTADFAGGAAEFRWFHKSVTKWAALPADAKDARTALRYVLRFDSSADANARGVDEVLPVIARLETHRSALRKALGDDYTWGKATLHLMMLRARNGQVDQTEANQDELRTALERLDLRAHPLYPMSLLPLTVTLRSEPRIREAIARLKDIFGESHPQALSAYSALADWCELAGETEEAIRVRRLVVGGYRRLLRGEGTSDVSEVTLRQNYALAVKKLLRLVGSGDPTLEGTEPEAELKRWIEVSRQAHGEASIEHAMALAHLARFYRSRGDQTRALDVYGQIKTVLDVVGPRVSPHIQHLILQNVAEFLAEVSLGSGEFAAAEKTLKGIIRSALPREDVTSTMWYLMFAQAAQGKRDEAIQTQLRLLTTERQSLDEAVIIGSESLVQRWASAIEPHLQVLIALLAEGKPDAKAIELIWTAILHQKGIVLDAGCRFREAQLAASADPQLAARVQALRIVQEKLRDLDTRPQTGVSSEQLERERQKFRLEQTRIETDLTQELARRQPTLLTSNDAPTLAQVRQKLPRGTALVEYVYSLRLVKTPGKGISFASPRYFALVLPSDPNTVPHLIDLGASNTIETAVQEWRALMANFREAYRAGKVKGQGEAERAKELAEKGRELDRLLVAPIRPHLEKNDALLLVPDGPLHHLPFAALVDEKGKYLIETHRVGYLSSARDLLRLPSTTTGSGIVVFADPDVDLVPAARWNAVRELRIAQSSSRFPSSLLAFPLELPRALGLMPTVGPATRSPAEGTRLAQGRLPEALKEADDVETTLRGKKEFGGVKTMKAEHALEERLKAVRSPRILHLAMHGFYYQQLRQPEKAVGIETQLRLSANPLLRSGLLLAGVNRWRDEAPDGAVLEDGYFTAEEAALLDLRGTELVVLSACEAGLGDVKSNEGVYGLRRAFLYAGARSVIATLEQVPDVGSRRLMRGFYERLAAGKGRSAALHDAQLEVIAERQKKDGAAHPFFWANFILIGDGG